MEALAEFLKDRAIKIEDGKFCWQTPDWPYGVDVEPLTEEETEKYLDILYYLTARSR